MSTTAICRMVFTRALILSAVALGEGFGAVAALEQEGLALGRGGEALAQNVDLSGEHQRRQRGQFLDRGVVGGGAVPARLLLDRQRAPHVQTGIEGRAGVADRDSGGGGKLSHP